MRFAKFALLSYILERDKKNAVLFRADYSMKIEKGRKENEGKNRKNGKNMKNRKKHKKRKKTKKSNE